VGGCLPFLLNNCDAPCYYYVYVGTCTSSGTRKPMPPRSEQARMCRSAFNPFCAWSFSQISSKGTEMWDYFKITKCLITVLNFKPQCCGSVTFWGSVTKIAGSGSISQRHGSTDPDSAIFVTEPQDDNKKLIWKKVFCSLLFEGTLAIIFKDKKSKISHQAVGIKVFLTIFAWW
jgi:hypothetical protein